MNRLLPLLMLVLALPAAASDSDVGKRVFEANCAQCHMAGPASKDAKAPNDTDNLALWLSAHSSTELRAWVKDPSAVRKETRCDTRRLKAEDVSDLLSYLRGASTAPSTPAP